jgi:hypothetical protein
MRKLVTGFFDGRIAGLPEVDLSLDKNLKGI